MTAGGRFYLTIVACSMLIAAGCRSTRPQQDYDYALLEDAVAESWHSSDLLAAKSVNPIVEELSGPHPVEKYIRYALAQNADIQAALKRVEAAGYRVPQAASLPDPTLGMNVYAEQVQTAAGQQEISLMASQKLPWPGKLSLRAAVAEEDAERARAELEAVELAVIEKVKRAYYDLYYLQQAIRITEQDRQLLVHLEKLVDIQTRVNLKSSQQDLLRVQLEILLRDNDLIRLRQQLASGQAHLARQLHISPDTPLLALERLPPQQLPHDLDQLYRQAVGSRPELQAQLAAIMRDRRKVDLAQLNYLPDVTLGLTWIDTSAAGISGVANGRDAVILGASVNLPVYRKRLAAGVHEAEARAVASARQYDSLRDQTLEEVKDLFVQATSQHEMLELFKRDIIPKAEHTLEVSQQAYEVKVVDFLQVIDNWRRLLQFKIAYQRLESQLRQTLAKLEQLLGSSGRDDFASNVFGNNGPAPQPLVPLPTQPIPKPNEPQP